MTMPQFFQKADSKDDEKCSKFPAVAESPNESPVKEQQSLFQENHLLLQGLTSYITKDSRSVSS